MSEVYQIWEETDPQGDGGITLATKEGCEEQAARGLLGSAPVLVLEFEAETWEEACQRQHDYCGWGSYRPMSEAIPANAVEILDDTLPSGVRAFRCAWDDRLEVAKRLLKPEGDFTVIEIHVHGPLDQREGELVYPSHALIRCT